MRMGRSGRKIAGLCLAGMLLATAPAGAAEAPTAEPLAQLEAAMGSEAVRSAHYRVMLTARAPMGEAVGQAELTFVQDPFFRSQGNVQLDVAPLQDVMRPFRRAMPFFVRESEKALAVYFRQGDEWTKTVTERKELSPAQRKEADRLSEECVQAALSLVKEVRALPAGEGGPSFEVTVDGERLAQAVREAMAGAGKRGKPQAESAAATAALDSIGDFRCTLTLDGASGQVSALHADLTEPCRRAAMAALMASDGKAMEKLEYAALIESTTVAFDLEGDSFQQVEDVTIPAEVVAAAKAQEKARLI